MEGNAFSLGNGAQGDRTIRLDVGHYESHCRALES